MVVWCDSGGGVLLLVLVWGCFALFELWVLGLGLVVRWFGGFAGLLYGFWVVGLLWCVCG